MSIPTNWRALCAENVSKKARAYLAQPEQEGPTDEELLELMPDTMRDELSYAAKVCSDATNGQVKPGIFRVCLNHTALEYARAAIAADRARSALAQPEQEGQEVQLNWQPIATAPLDQMILVYRPDHYLPWCSVAPAKYESDQYASKPKPYWRSWLACRSKFDDREYPPTHWVPWPTAPANEEPSQ